MYPSLFAFLWWLHRLASTQVVFAVSWVSAPRCQASPAAFAFVAFVNDASASARLDARSALPSAIFCALVFFFLSGAADSCLAFSLAASLRSFLWRGFRSFESSLVFSFFSNFSRFNRCFFSASFQLVSCFFLRSRNFGSNRVPSSIRNEGTASRYHKKGYKQHRTTERTFST